MRTSREKEGTVTEKARLNGNGGGREENQGKNDHSELVRRMDKSPFKT